MRFHLSRFAGSPDGTYGRLLDDEGNILYDVLEEEWRNNERGESRIPANTYICRRTTYHKYGYETFEISGVPNRDRILFHPGNTEEDTDGCVLIGQGFGPIEVIDEETGERRDKIGVYHSQVTFRLFMQRLAGIDVFELTITDPEWEI